MNDVTQSLKQCHMEPHDSIVVKIIYILLLILFDNTCYECFCQCMVKKKCSGMVFEPKKNVVDTDGIFSF